MLGRSAENEKLEVTMEYKKVNQNINNIVNEHLIPILENLYISTEEFLKEIKEVKIK